jgi:DNA-binding response OmpR family regulator
MPWEKSSTSDPWTTEVARSQVGAPQPPFYLHLTAKESALLLILAVGAGEPVSSEELLSELYPDGNINKNTIEVHVHNLRKKTRLCRDFRIDTVLHQGYVLNYLNPPTI